MYTPNVVSLVQYSSVLLVATGKYCRSEYLVGEAPPSRHVRLCHSEGARQGSLAR